MARKRKRAGAERKPDIWEKMGVPPADPKRPDVFSEQARKVERMPEEKKRRRYEAACIAAVVAAVLCVAFGAGFDPGAAEQAPSASASASAAASSSSVSSASASSSSSSDVAPSSSASEAADPAESYLNPSILSKFLSQGTVQRFEAGFLEHIRKAGYSESDMVRCYDRHESGNGRTVWWVSTASDGQFWRCGLENASGKLSYAKDEEPSGLRKAEEKKAKRAEKEAAEKTAEKVDAMEPMRSSKTPKAKLVSTRDAKALRECKVPRAAAAKLDSACRSYLKSKGADVPKKLYLVASTVKRSGAGTTTMRVYAPTANEALAIEAEWHADAGSFGMELGSYLG